VDNVGLIGEFMNLIKAVAAVRHTIDRSGRAGDHGYVLDENGELVREIGKPAREGEGVDDASRGL